MKGIRWSVGCGKSIGIYSSNWVPRPSTFRPVLPPTLPTDSLVADLILKGNSWNVPMLRHCFLDMDVQQILKIKLPYQPCEDQVLWHYDRKGEYSVKSGYNLAVQIRDSEYPVSSRDESCVWQAVWKLNVPPKVRIFLWRALLNILPTMEKLQVK